MHIIKLPMKADPKATISPKLLFIENGKLTHNHPCLTGPLHIKDTTNLATILGKFKNGICESADIYRNQKNIISNIQVQIHEDGSIKMGGRKVKEERHRLIYEGGYSGYCRNGYGEYYLSDQQIQSGVWKHGKKYGEFVEEYSADKTYKALVLNYKKQQVEQEIMQLYITQKSQSQFDMIYKQRKVIKFKGQISKEQALKQKAKIAQIKKNLQNPFQQLVIPLARVSSSKIQKLQLKQLDKDNKLTFDQCQAYLQYLFHSQHYQSNKFNQYSQLYQPTAILSIYTSNYIDNLYDISKDYKQQMEDYQKSKKEIKNQVTHIMDQFRHQYTLFRGFWKHIIIPLSQFHLFKHFSFIRVTIHKQKLQFVYYDSMPHSNLIQKMKAHYLKIVKKVLTDELIKHTKINIKKMIDEATLKVFQGFPIQESNDKNSCGFFILQGIADLMMYGKIIFSSKQLSSIKDRILQKLKEMKCPNDIGFKQNAL